MSFSCGSDVIQVVAQEANEKIHKIKCLYNAAYLVSDLNYALGIRINFGVLF